jgi:two-component system OmpR family response regulator
MAETKKKVLLVDDEPAILKILGIKLRVSGFEVVTAINGQEALTLIDSARPDIVLLDVIMPGIDGFEVLRRLRGSSLLPVIVFSARLENARKALSLGADYFLSKPFDIDDVIERIRSLLKNGNSRHVRD